MSTDRPDAPLGASEIVCPLDSLGTEDARGFQLGGGEWPLQGIVVRHAGVVHAYVNRCPHAGHPLHLAQDRFLSKDRQFLVCASHGALFELATGRCIAGPCAGASLTPLKVCVERHLVMLDPTVNIADYQQ
jgi:nitrite reductase/ring-hydroxylating ferredoxin subunit